MQMFTELYLCFFWVLWERLAAKGRKRTGGVFERRQPKDVCSLLSCSLICHGFSPFLVKAFPRQASWVDFCQSWMSIGVLDSYSPGQSPEPALLFMFDLPFKFPEEVGWTKDQRFPHLLLLLPYDSLSASRLAQQQINSSTDHRLRISLLLVEKAVQMDPKFQRRFCFFFFSSLNIPASKDIILFFFFSIPRGLSGEAADSRQGSFAFCFFVLLFLFHFIFCQTELLMVVLP